MIDINRHKVFSFGPSSPNDTSDLIGECDGGFVVTAGLFDAKGPCSEAVRGVEFFSVRDNGACAVDEEHSEVTVTAL